MSTTWKFLLNPGRAMILMPQGAQVLTAQMQYEEPFLWARVDPSRPSEKRVFCVYGTGHPIPDDQQLIYVATLQMDGGALVWHVFESAHAT